MMECFVCSAESEKLPILGDWIELRCDGGCGHYRLSGTLERLLSVNQRRLDKERTRVWLGASRVTRQVPMITDLTAIYA